MNVKMEVPRNMEFLWFHTLGVELGERHYWTQAMYLVDYLVTGSDALLMIVK